MGKADWNWKARHDIMGGALDIDRAQAKNANRKMRPMKTKAAIFIWGGYGCIKDLFFLPGCLFLCGSNSAISLSEPDWILSLSGYKWSLCCY